MEENMVVIREPRTFCFDFDCPKDVDKNLKREIRFIIKCNDNLTQNKMKNEIEQLLSHKNIETIFMNTENKDQT